MVNATKLLTWTKIFSLALMILASFVLLGWLLNITFLKSIVPGLATMKPNTALSFLLTGLAFWLIQSHSTVTRKSIAQVCTLLIFMMGVLTLSEYYWGWNLGIDQLFATVLGLAANPGAVARMSVAIAFGFALLGVSLFLLLNTRRFIIIQICALLILGVGALALAGYLFGVSSLYRESLFNNIALHTALAFCISGLVILLATSQEGFVAVINQNYLGGVMARRLLPAVIIVPLIIGWFRLQGQYLGYYDTVFGVALFAVSTIIVLTTIVWWTALLLNQIDREHQRAAVELKRYGQRMEILHTIDRGLIASAGIPELINDTLKKLRVIIPCQRIAITLLDETTQELVIFAADTELESPFDGLRLPPTPNIFEGFSDDNTRFIDDLRVETPYSPPKSVLERGFLTLLQVLLIQDGQPIGLLSLAATTTGFFTPEYRQIAIEVGHQLSIALKQMRLSESIQKANSELGLYARRMEILHNIDRGIIASQAAADIAASTFKELRLLIPCQRISLKLLDEASQELVVYAADADTNPLNINRIPLLPNMLTGFDERNMRLIQDILLEKDRVPLADEYLEQGFVTLLQILLVQANAIQGIITLASTTHDFFTPEYREIAIEVSNQLAIAIKQMRLSDALKMANDTLEQRVIERTAELNAAKEQVEAILNNSLDGILLTNADMRIQKTNPAFEKLFGHTQSLESLLDVVDKEDAVQVSTTAKTAMSGMTIMPIEVRARREDGTTFDVELSIGYIEGDGFVSTVHDITGRKMLERQLRYQASIQNTVADAVIATDLEFNIQSWNKAAERIYGWQTEEVIGKPIRDILKTEYSTRQLAEEVRRVFLEDGHWTGEVAQHRRDGKTIYILSSTVLFKDSNGNPFGVLAVNHDITERKQAEDALRQALEQEKEVNEMKTRFISIASHEFRSPLAAISMLTESLSAYRDKMEPEQINQRLERIQQQVAHVTDIMDDVLESARMQGDYLNFKPVQANLDKLYREIVEEFAERPEFGGRIHYSCDESDRLSRFDLRLMRQIFTNLLSNALKYSPSGNPVKVKLVHADRHIILDVSDEGIGIPEEDLKYIFKPFHRAANVGSISGTGLGMSITKKAVEMHGGTIEVKSILNLGTTFTVVIPTTVT